ncbi:MAG: fructose-6-phosphate aldolase [Pseudomonadota bacterium]
MKFFIDTGNTQEIKQWARSGLLDGVTTNPSLVAKQGVPFAQLIADICKITDGPVSAEVTSEDADGMIAQAEILAKIADNVVIKLPLTPAGIQACAHLTDKGIQTNVTLCFSVAQALLAAKAGATYVSPFMGRLDDIGHDGVALVADIVAVYAHYPELKTQVLAASIRSPGHVVAVAKAGAHVVTLPPAVLAQLFVHPLTDKGLAAFLRDAEAAEVSI